MLTAQCNTKQYSPCSVYIVILSPLCTTISECNDAGSVRPASSFTGMNIISLGAWFFYGYQSQQFREACVRLEDDSRLLFGPAQSTLKKVEETGHCLGRRAPEDNHGSEPASSYIAYLGSPHLPYVINGGSKRTLAKHPPSTHELDIHVGQCVLIFSPGGVVLHASPHCLPIFRQKEAKNEFIGYWEPLTSPPTSPGTVYATVKLTLATRGL